MERVLKVELHCHTIYSKDSLTKVRDMLQAARDMGIDRLAITDHNNIRGALAAKEMDPELVIVGEEVHTTRGELLAYYLREEVPAYLTPAETLRRFKTQGAFVSVPHPFDPRRSGWSRKDLLEIASQVDAIEAFNSRCQLSGYNEQAAEFAREQNKPVTAGSDAHMVMELGHATMRLPAFDSADDLRRVIHQGQIDGRLSPAWVHASSMYSKIYKRFFTTV